MDLSKYRPLFLSEAEEMLSRFRGIGEELNKGDFTTEDLNEGFRKIHSLKSMAGSMGYAGVSEFCHGLEDFLDALRKADGYKTGPLLRVWDFAAQELSEAIEKIRQEKPTAFDAERLATLIADYEQAEAPEHDETPSPQTPEEAEPPAFAPAFLKIPVERMQRLSEAVTELVHLRHHLHGTLREEGIKIPAFAALESKIGLIAESVLRMQLLPFSLLLEPYHAHVRMLAESLGKQVDFQVKGEQLEADRSILSRLSDPLSHFVRNALDHGIETPEERKQAGKSPVGKLSVHISRSGQQIKVVIADDGRGMDRDALAALAVEQGKISSEAAENLDLVGIVTMPGFTSKSASSMISGRGVGLDGALAEIGAVGGVLDIASTPGEGTKVILRLPLRMALLSGIFLRSGERQAILPTSSVGKALLLPESAAESVAVGGKRYPLAPLGALLGEGAEAPTSGLLVKAKTASFVLGVNQILGEEEVLVLPMPPPYSRLPLFSGATTLTSGEVVPVLSPQGLLKAAQELKAFA